MINKVIWPGTFQPLQRLQLRHLTFIDSNVPGKCLDGRGIAIADLQHIFGSHQTLRRLEFNWASTGQHLFERDLTKVMWQLAAAYPNLECLEFPQGELQLPFAPNPVAHSTATVMFPNLRGLKIFGLQNPENQSDAE